MSLRVYFDQNCQEEVKSNINPEGKLDIMKGAVASGKDFVNEKELYIKSDDSSLTYEAIVFTNENDEDSASKSGEADIEFSVDGGKTWEEIINFENQDFANPVAVKRRVVAPNVTKAFKRTDIKYALNYNEFVK